MPTAVAYILKSWVDQVNQVTGVRAVYSPDVSIPRVPDKIRKLHIRVDQGVPLLEGGEPVILFSRQVLKPMEGLGRVHKAKTSLPSESNLDIDLRKVAFCSIPLDCLFVSKDWQVMESFEVNYLLEEGIRKILQFDVDYGDPLGVFNYKVKWGEFESFQVLVDDLDSKGLFFSCEIVGPVISNVTEVAKAVREIRIFVEDYTTKALIEEIDIIK